MAKIVLKDLVKQYFDGKKVVHTAAKNNNLTIEDGEFMVLVGPSGCGKSTTLRMIAGLEDITSGTVTIDGVVVNDLPPRRRNVAMVFQNYALYPHMTVYNNMAFALKLMKINKKEIHERVTEAAHSLGLSEYLDRKPKALSGGQRQRVAVGRSIVCKPKVFLFDEPLSNLDAKMRVSMRAEISQLHKRLKTTMIYVTHDQIEAMTMGDRICVINDGEIMQVADPLTLYHDPVNMFVAGFIGSPPMNLIRGKIVSESNHLVFVEDADKDFEPFRIRLTPELAQRVKGYAGKEIVFGIRPESVFRNPERATSPTDQPIQARVELAEVMGASTNVYLNSGGKSFIARLGGREKYTLDQKLEVYFDLSAIHFFDASTEKAIR